MATITFDEIRARVDAFHVAHNAPLPAARRTVRELAVLLADLTPAERSEIRTEVAALMDELAAEAAA